MKKLIEIIDVPKGNGITLENGQFGWDFILKHDNGKTALIQTDWDYPGVARAFGWTGNDNEIEKAENYLGDHIGDRVEDPGYFE